MLRNRRAKRRLIGVCCRAVVVMAIAIQAWADPADSMPMTVGAEARRVASPDDSAQRLAGPEALRLELREIETLIRAAHFRTALAMAKATRPGTDQAVPNPERAEFEVLVATAEIALGHDVAAGEAMRRALDAEPTLALPGSVSPKVRALLQETRRIAGRVNP